MPELLDIAIVGAGPAGLALACLAAAEGLRVAVIEQAAEAVLRDPPADGRDIALTHRSRQILQRIGAFERFAATDVSEIRAARVRSGAPVDLLNIGSDGRGEQALGFLVANRVIRAALYEGARENPAIEIRPSTEVLDLDTDATSARLVLSGGGSIGAALAIAADSRFSKLRRKAGIGADMRDFGRVCIVCRMRHERPHDGTAYEWFADDRTLAVLPLAGRMSSIVVTVPADAAPHLMQCAPEQLAEDVERRFARRWGRMEVVGLRHAYPLVAVYAHRFHAHRLALIGDAAVGMHPVTAHGYNFGLRGAETLVAGLGQAHRTGGDIGAEPVLARYSREHRRATYPLYLATNALVDLYTDNGALAGIARQALLRLGNALPPVKDFMRHKLTEVDATQVPA